MRSHSDSGNALAAAVARLPVDTAWIDGVRTGSYRQWLQTQYGSAAQSAAGSGSPAQSAAGNGSAAVNGSAAAAAAA